ncbi:hypothetical protein ACLMJK_008753 [Lecanora helva]
MSALPIIIAGAGIAGLTLGRCLKKRHIPSIIIGKASYPPRPKYDMTLQSWAYRELLAVLQLDENVFRRRVAVDATKGGRGKIPKSIDPDPESFRCHRGRLDRLLREGLDIRWGHTIKDVKTSAKQISIKIDDREAIQAQVLIGADGVHSTVRKSVAPQIQPKVLPYVVFNGTRKVTLRTFIDKIQPQMQRGTISQSNCGDVLLQIAVTDFHAREVVISYTYSRPAREDDPLHRPDRPITRAEDIPEAFYEELESLKELGQAYAEMFDAKQVRKDRVLHWLMRTAMGSEEDIQGLADRGVLLVGDAAHAMPILGGEGGNTAMKDGVDLAECLFNHGLQGIKTFSAERYTTWKQGVEQSERRLNEMHAPASKAVL